ncbi:hypothetical protein [Candidatus Nitrosocosmicus hydrocola]|uniref:hypothetical protein n=1 Tax=Candidatus Nitrosocosmicus hydrocola TaxID=1826872 RepID=UPI0011E5C554|nr:hypothetical protein [Candidatus Nitrosocosmicus hydrocola]
MVRYKIYIIFAIFVSQFIILGGIGGGGESGILSVENASGQSTVTSATNTTNSKPNSSQDELTVNYYARFNCGSIDDDNGPLRPGKYDSDITIFNKKDFPITIIWKAISVNQQYKSNFNILNVPSESIVNINCAKIFPFSQTSTDDAASSNISNTTNNLSNNFAEGIVKIEISINDGLLVNNFLNNQIGNMIIDASEISNLVNVDVLHTVNTLDNLNKEALYLKTDFSKLSSDRNGMDNFTALFKINPDEIINPVNLIKNKLDSGVSNTTNTSDILVGTTEIISNTFTDNHALTVQKVEPIIS